VEAESLGRAAAELGRERAGGAPDEEVGAAEVVGAVSAVVVS